MSQIDFDGTFSFLVLNSPIHLKLCVTQKERCTDFVTTSDALNF